MSRFLRLIAAAGVIFVAGCGRADALRFRGGDESRLTESEVFQPVDLRGYGTLSGVLWRDADNGSVLQIKAGDVGKAQLVQAKYLSDLSVLPGTLAQEIDSGKDRIHVVEAEGQGTLAAIRIGTEVFILASPTKAAFLHLLSRTIEGPVTIAASAAQVEVPMFLDRWDKFGFRFYYRPWEMPSDPAQASNYDIKSEFDYAANQGRIGLLLWAKLNSIDTAEGLSDEDWWDWAQLAAADKKVPVGLQLQGATASQTWLMNRYRDEAAQKMPQFVGNFYSIALPGVGNMGWLSWCSDEGKEAQFGVLQDIASRMVRQGNVVSLLEPHGETRHGMHEIFQEYGPVADASFRRFLEGKYGNITSLNKAWDSRYDDFNKVRVPDLAEFAGWRDGALDLQGIWRIAYEAGSDGKQRTMRELVALDKKKVSTTPAPEEWFAEGFDDSTWLSLKAPGDDRQMYLPYQPAVFRQTFTVPAGWRKDGQRAWLYVWDLSKEDKGRFRAVLNGREIANEEVSRIFPHWGAYEVTDLLRDGQNVLALRLPRARLAYRVYLSTEEPKQYPNLGPALNARWVDFSDWMAWVRMEALRRGMQMIRQVAPDQQITLMHPDDYADGIKSLAKEFGGNFHNTGYMSGIWADFLPALMRGAQLPFTLEPGGPAANVSDLRRYLGNWSTEGLQGVDYFIHIGNVMWNPEIRKEFERQLNLFHLIGKYHSPRAEVASLYSDRNHLLFDFPWKFDPKTNIGTSYWDWNLRKVLRDKYESDGLTESSFETGDAARYRVILDSSTSTMDPPLVDAIEQYVRDGGVFVTSGHTGRNTSLEQDSWPISRLTGYRVQSGDEGGWKPRNIRLAPDQKVFEEDWTRFLAGKGLDGLKLEKIDPDATDIAYWEDGSVAIGMRKIGKGYIIQVGCRFGERGIGHSLGLSKSGKIEQSNIAALAAMVEGILKWQGVKPDPVAWTPGNITVIPKHFISNNGLYDIWVVFNQSADQTIDGALEFDSTITAEWAIDIQNGQRQKVTGRRISVTLPPEETRAFLTPRNDVASAPAEWFRLQRNWWQGVAKDLGPAFPKPSSKFLLDLGKDWAFRPVSSPEEAAGLCAENVDENGWERMRLGIWTLPDHADVKYAVFRKHFTVPESWSGGDASLWLNSWFGRTFVDQGRIWLDGKPLTEKLVNDGVAGVNPGGVLKPGSSHVLAVEVKGAGSLAGVRGTAWLWYWPKPVEKMDLGGVWQSTLEGDPLTPGPDVTLPGKFDGMVLRRSVTVPESQKDRRVVINVVSQGKVGIVVVNGRLVSRHHHFIGDHWQLDVTPFIQFGRENEIQLISLGKGNIEEVGLWFFDSGTYP